MRADSVHGAIGKLLKRTQNILTFNELENLIKRISPLSKIDAIPMALSDFLNWEEYFHPNLFPIAPIKEAQFRHGSLSVNWKTSFDSEAYSESPFITENDLKEIPPSHSEMRGIDSRK